MVVAMIVCICNNVNSMAIEQAIDNGADSLDVIRNQTGAGACCGKCQFKVNRILKQKMQDKCDARVAIVGTARS